MNAATAILTVGTRLRHDGETHTVVGLDGSRLTLRSARGTVMQVDVGFLLGHPTTRIVGAADGPVEALGTALSDLTPVEAEEVRERLAHVREVLSGYRGGSAETAAPGEPRCEYDPSLPLMVRYQAKADELGVGLRSLRRWVKGFQELGPAGLVDGRGHRRLDPLRGVDQRWLDVCAAVLDEHVDASRPTRDLLLQRVEARVEQAHGKGVVPGPARKRARQVLAELSRGTNAFVGSTKGKRSIANRPEGPYGRLRPTRPGEYLLLDTTTLDVFAMESLTLRWVKLELTIALDLLTRCIVGLRLSPVSTKAVDAALVLYEAINPNTTTLTGSGLVPYHGVPTVVVVDPDRLSPTPKGLPGMAAETLVVDHGKIYLSEHLFSVCARLGISIQPARPYTPTDKAAVERFFRTLNEQLLAALPGYKGPDVYSRGKDVESQAYFFVDELERVIREWVATIYHQRPHDGLVDPAVPGLHYSPLEMFEHGVARCGRLRVPARADLVYDFLPVVWRTIQHYGVEAHGLRYNGAVLSAYRNRTSPYTGANAGKWPFRFDPDDVSRMYFQDPADNSWHLLRWEHAQEIPAPFSAEALAYARRLAAQRDRFPDDRRALADLLERWDVGLTANPNERRMALRLSQQRSARADQHRDAAAEEVAGLASVRDLFPPAPAPEPAVTSSSGPHGDDDDEAELDAAAPDEVHIGADVDDEEYYADALGSLD
ncbi:MAG: integrase [Acidimicrobiales bacterium]